MKVFYLLLSFIFTFSTTLTRAQRASVKTNVLYDALGTVSIGGEIKFREQWTIGLSANYKNWGLSRKGCWKQWSLQPGMRFWLCESFGGHFVGAQLQGGMYNIGNIKNGLSFLNTDFSRLAHRRYQGWEIGASLAYGYAWILNRHWNLEAEAAAGYSFTRSDHYPCNVCGERTASGKVHHYIGPTRLAFNIVYIW